MIGLKVAVRVVLLALAGYIPMALLGYFIGTKVVESIGLVLYLIIFIPIGVVFGHLVGKALGPWVTAPLDPAPKPVPAQTQWTEDQL